MNQLGYCGWICIQLCSCIFIIILFQCNNMLNVDCHDYKCTYSIEMFLRFTIIIMYTTSNEIMLYIN